jgi:hypothetical protein
MAAPITVDRLMKELEKLKAAMDAGELKHGDYDQRLSRVIQELRERGLDADREELNTAIANALEKGIITSSVEGHLKKRLGLA